MAEGVEIMKRTRRSGVTIALALVAAEQVLADGSETQNMSAMIADIEFITQNSLLEYAGQALPDVIVVTENELQLRFHASKAQVLALEDAHSFGRVSAFYDRYASKVFLSDVSSFTGPGLLHELVHFLQEVNGKNDMFVSYPICLEAEAYDLQALWQAEHGIDLDSKPDYGFVMTLYGICNDADFSWVDSAYQH